MLSVVGYKSSSLFKYFFILLPSFKLLFCPGQAKFEHFLFLGWVEIIQTFSKPCKSTLNVVYLVLCRGFISDVNIVPRPCKLLVEESVLKVIWGLQSRHYRTVLLHQVHENYIPVEKIQRRFSPYVTFECDQGFITNVSGV